MTATLASTLLDTRPRPDELPVLRVETADPTDWVARHRDALRAATVDHGAVLVRGLDIDGAPRVGAILHRLGAPPMTEREAFAPRHTYAEGVHSSTKWPTNQPMCMHHELSYAYAFPSLMLFGCVRAPEEGGATAVADSTAVLEALPGDLTDRFEREGWILTRSYNGEIGACVAEAFGTEDRDVIARHCRDNAIDFDWLPDGTLRTTQRRSAVVRHPIGGQRCWFNQIAFLNEWTLDPEIRGYLVDEYGADGLPFNTLHGNGEPLTEDTVRRINSVYEAHTVRRPWQTGDLLLLDNLRTAHAREPFRGPRDVVVAMADPLRLPDCAPTIEVTVS